MAMLELELEDRELLRLLLMKELEETRVEVRHTYNMDFKHLLLEREARIQELITKLA